MICGPRTVQTLARETERMDQLNRVGLVADTVTAEAQERLPLQVGVAPRDRDEMALGLGGTQLRCDARGVLHPLEIIIENAERPIGDRFALMGSNKRSGSHLNARGGEMRVDDPLAVRCGVGVVLEKQYPECVG